MKSPGRASKPAVSSADPAGAKVPCDRGPSTKPGLQKNMTVSTGPAKGWRVTAWLQDIEWNKEVSAADRAVRWHISTPDRKRTYKAWAHLQEEASEGVYTQIHLVVRPALLQRINLLRQALEGPGVQQKRKAQCLEADDASDALPPHVEKQARCKPASPAKAHAQAGTKEAGRGRWSCSCDGHFIRHPRCISAGSQQPSLVHLSDCMVIGRADTCDLQLDSRRTPQMISRCHVVLSREDGVFMLTDQDSLNGVLVNGERVKGKQALSGGDVITFGVATPHPELDYIFEARPSDYIGDETQLLAPLGA